MTWLLDCIIINFKISWKSRKGDKLAKLLMIWLSIGGLGFGFLDRQINSLKGRGIIGK